MALRTNEAQLSLFPVDLMVVMAAQPAQAVSPSLPTFGFRQEENGTVTLEEVLENGLQYLREQAGPGHHFSQAEVSKALSAFKQWMKAIPEDEDGSRYARYFITEFMDSGFCLHPDDYPAYAFPAKPSVQTEATAEDDDVPERDEADQTAQADVSPAVAEAIAEDDGENLLEGEVPLDLSILKMLLASRVFNSVTTTQYIGTYRGGRRSDPACHGVMERYQQRIQTVQSVSALEAATEEFLKNVPEIFHEVRAEMKALEKQDRKADALGNPEAEQCLLGDDNAPEGMAFP